VLPTRRRHARGDLAAQHWPCVAATGFTLNNFALVVAPAPGGASGSLLTKLWRRGWAALWATSSRGVRRVRTAPGASGAANSVARLGRGPGTLLASQRVIIVPGTVWRSLSAARGARYGGCSRKRSVSVGLSSGRRPVLGTDVLLAEANVPYEQLKEMDQVNAGSRTPTWLIVGAGRGQPAARNSLARLRHAIQADRAKNIIFMKRSCAPASRITTTSCSARRRSCSSGTPGLMTSL
jgi:NAD(P) transhydrogenase subunit beta